LKKKFTKVDGKNLQNLTLLAYQIAQFSRVKPSNNAAYRVAWCAISAQFSHTPKEHSEWCFQLNQCIDFQQLAMMATIAHARG
jgi:hypothetical protein